MISLLRNLRYRFRISTTLFPISCLHSSNQTLAPDSKLDFILQEVEELQSLKPDRIGEEDKKDNEKISSSRNTSPTMSSVVSKVQISHPWPEWVELMERLLNKGYFEGSGYPFNHEQMSTKDTNQIRTACLNFARDRFDLLRYFSRKDIQMIVGSGCPSIDRKVVNSGKRLRAHVGIDEGNVCSSCSLRGNCERAYVKAREDEGGRTVDIMRILLVYGLDPIVGSVENKSCLDKRVKESVRRLLNEMVEFSTKEIDSFTLKATTSKRISPLSEQSGQQQQNQISVPMKQGDWVCPKCNFINFARNIKCLCCDGIFRERLVKLGEDQDHLPMKKGDWLCDKCNFLNFAKNIRCLQCKEKPPKRQLNPGEWECESCSYLNFKRNMRCLKCDWQRPKASSYPGTLVQIQREGGGFHQRHGIKFVTNDDVTDSQPSSRRERQNCRDSEDGHRGDAEFSPWKNFQKFEDFPIVGGKSAVSQSPLERERWKVEMSKRHASARREKETADDFNSLSFRKRPGLLEATDDEEMAGWFGYGKETRTGKYISETEACND
ncbi:PREDICTED: uncharacterized protein LOC104605676 isoform X2 [Nelumbo nucifera]|uniref:RanBP2-type domain-containing protein n=2 Tax=Nelumbo nucifera TaxID=4432 RepID=A0A822XSQ2_NELNU|nr:PREDICTED: uncharacterized protein LOC104605676 isoform X2 [Nelumbo nucifera]DAD23042.1 TPA_asm: hypothetical protein HUJ06_024505 [Nelumbo nucifera]